LKLFGALDGEGNLLESGADKGFLIVAAIRGTVAVAGGMTHFATTKERVRQKSEETGKIPVFGVLDMLMNCRAWWLNMAYVVCYGVANIVMMQSMTYFATYVLGSTAYTAAIMLVFLVSSTAASFFVGLIDRAAGRKKAMALAAFIILMGKLWFLLNPYSLAAVYGSTVCSGFGLAVGFVLFNTNRSVIADMIEAKHGRRIDSVIPTSDNFLQKLATAGATFLSTAFLSLAGYNAELSAQPEAAVNTIIFLIGGVPAILAAVMLAVALLNPIEREETGGAP
ncbi:MAG: MFS transporter, partial [Oscillospiraceae bacterium]|nr:MFS transporter [Oscillospiraceae bacterium]